MARKSRKSINVTAKHSATIPDTIIKKDDGLKTAAYIRLSVENNGHETEDSIHTQIQLVHDFINEHSELSLTDTYVDNGYSGTRFDRPEFVRMIDDVKCGKIQCIVVKDLSRFGRDYLETGYYIETIFPLLDVRFIAITDQFDSKREADLNTLSVPIKNMINAMYAKEYSKKQEVFRVMCKRTGRVMGINAPYGYRFSSENKKLEIDEEVAPYVRMIFAWALIGVKRLEITKRMELIGAPTPAINDKWEKQGEHWTEKSIQQILYNPVYAGFHVMGKSKVSLYKNMKPTRINRSEWIYFPEFHEPYITMDEYERIQKVILENKNQMDARLQEHRDIREQISDVFKGKVYCLECGRQMNFARGSHHRGNDDLSFAYYRCRNSKEFAKCSNKKFQQNFLKIVVMDQIRILIKTACDKNTVLEMVQKNLVKQGCMDHVQRNIIRLSKKEQELDDKLLKAYMDFADKILDAGEYQMIKEKFLSDKAVVAEKMENMKKKHAEMERVVKQYQNQAEKLEKYLVGTEFDEKLVNELIDKIWISDGGAISIEFKCKDVFENTLIHEYIRENTERSK